MKTDPIGIFDSGIGGLTIWKALQRLLPAENTVYLADSKNAPYGEKDRETILKLSDENTAWLLKKSCKIVVVACNTATTNAIKHLRKKYTIPFIGIEPAIKPASLQTKTGKIGVLATEQTLISDLFSATSENIAADITIITQTGKGLVPLIEDGKATDKSCKDLLKSYLLPMVDQGIDHLVLGCSHYPYLLPVIKKIIPQHIKVIDSGFAVARQTKKVLETRGILNESLTPSRHVFFSNKTLKALKRMVPKKHTHVALIE